MLASLANAAEPETKKTLLFFGDSLTAGHGLENPDAAYPTVIQERINAAGLPYRVINAGLSGETTAGGLRRIDWVLRQPVDVFVLALGANDGLRGLPLDGIRQNLGRIFEKVRARNPDAKLVLAGMRLPTSMGAYAGAFANLFPQVAEEHGADLIPFLLEDVGGVQELNLRDAIHPNPKGHAIMAATVWRHLEPVL